MVPGMLNGMMSVVPPVGEYHDLFRLLPRFFSPKLCLASTTSAASASAASLAHNRSPILSTVVQGQRGKHNVASKAMEHNTPVTFWSCK